jgi:hypothetical protein
MSLLAMSVIICAKIQVEYLVIRYDEAVTVTSLIQSRGRARFPESRFLILPYARCILDFFLF